MRTRTKRLYLIAGLAAAFVAAAAIVQAIRQGSWWPILSVGWIPAVIVAAWPRTYRQRSASIRAGKVDYNDRAAAVSPAAGDDNRG